MKNNKNDLLIKTLFWTLWSMVLMACVYYIVKNAHWVIGDDAIVMNHTGSGLPFPPSHMINKSVGRFCPLAYAAYNVLLLFSDGYISPQAHYMLEAVFFVVYAVAFTFLILQVLKNQKPIWKYSIAFFAFLLCAGRAYPQFTECFATSWCYYTLLACFFVFSFLFHEYRNWGWGIAVILFANVLCYSSELGFIMPLGVGGSALFFSWKTLSKKEKLFNFILVGSALLFLTIYLAFIVPYATHYMTHVIDSSPVGNALRMLFAQKIVIVGFAVLLVRIVFVLKAKQPYEYFDAYLLTAFAYFCACAILKLDWTLYYNPVALLCIPAILYYLVKYLKPQYALALIAVMGLFYGMKIPKTIKHSQKHRVLVYTQVEKLTQAISNGVPVFWLNPDEEKNEDFDAVLRYCQCGWLTSYIRWNLRNDCFSINMRKVGVDTLNSGVWLMTAWDRVAFSNELGFSIDEPPFFNADSIYGYLIDSDGY